MRDMRNLRNLFRLDEELRNRAIVIVLLFVFIFSMYKIFEYRLESSSNDRVYDELRKEKPMAASGDEVSAGTGDNLQSGRQAGTAATDGNQPNGSGDNVSAATGTSANQPAPSMGDGFKRLLARNPETVGWVTVGGTRIDYPVVQSSNNEYYLNRNFDRKKSIWGAIFMDYRNTDKQLGRHTILYGHHMNDGSMFAAITRYAKPAFFKKNRIIRFDTLNRPGKWEVFAAYETSIDFNFIQTEFRSKRDYADFLDQLVARSQVKSGVRISADDQILTLSTCVRGNNKNRFVVHARRL